MSDPLAMPIASVARRGRAERLRGLYALTPEESDTARLIAKVEAALRGGASAVQYRNKGASASLRYDQADAISRLCRDHRALFIVNDDAALAARAGADGVHLGEDDADLAIGRRIVGSDALIGISCYSDLARARAAAAAGADYVAFGSLFASTVKPGARRASLALLCEARALGVPVVGIGGIDARNATEVAEAGADAIAVISALFEHADSARVERAAADIVAAFVSGQRSRCTPPNTLRPW